MSVLWLLKHDGSTALMKASSDSDDVITTTWELVDAVERIGTGGRPLLLVTARATYTRWPP